MTEEQVSFNDWQKLDLRVGKILKIEDIEGADKLYKLEVDLGKEIGKKTLVAGIKKNYDKDELKGKKCVIFVNLEPKKLKGIESKGMILAAVSEDETEIRLLEPDSEVEIGSKIR